MTGRELIYWILTNRLEDEEMFKDGSIAGFLTVEKYAAAAGVGPATVRAWIDLGQTPYIKIGETVFIPHATITKKDIEVV